MTSLITFIVLVLVSIAFGYLRIDGYRSPSYQALVHFYVAGLFVL